MATQNKPVLGYRQCPDCQERGTVHQAGGKRAAYLYQRCGCGADQRNGAWIQTRLWWEAEWLEGMQPAEPPAGCKPLEEWQARYGEKPADMEADTIEEASREAEEGAAGGDEDSTSSGDVSQEGEAAGGGGLLAVALTGIGLLLAAALKAGR